MKKIKQAVLMILGITSVGGIILGTAVHDQRIAVGLTMGSVVLFILGAILSTK